MINRAVLAFCLAILATPVGADECDEYRDALAVDKAMGAFVDFLTDTRALVIEAFGDVDDPAYLAVAANLDAAWQSIVDAGEFTNEAALRAANAALDAAELSAQHEAVVAAAANAWDAIGSAEGAAIAAAKARRTIHPQDWAGGITGSANAAYHRLVLAVACQ